MFLRKGDVCAAALAGIVEVTMQEAAMARTTERERDAAYIRSAERVLQRTQTAGRLTSSASADTLMRNLARMTRLAKFYRDAYNSLLDGAQ